MNRSTPLEEPLTRAFELAYFIHGDRTVALRVAAEAMAKLEVAAIAQYKRLYYTPTGRDGVDRTRTKVSVSELLLLQRLVYVESEPHEQQAEQTSLPWILDEEEMLIHFIKHLVQITTRRNSFYVTLGLGRLLHSYSTAETMEIYNLVVQDAGRVHDDYYFRSRKGRLMKELKERFGDNLRVVRGPRGEERFETGDSPNRHAELVRECLMIFTPWSTDCVIAAGIDPLAEEIVALAFNGVDPDEEHAIEVNRFHATLHPDCFARLITSLNFASPDERLASPCFFMNRDEDNDRNSRPPWYERRRPKLDGGDLDAVRKFLAEQSSRRKTSAAGLLRILVDGRERARLDLNRASRLKFAVQESDELIEVRVAQGEGDLLLVSHLLNDNESKQSRQTSIVLEAGQKLSFTIAPVEDNPDEEAGRTIHFSYRETRPARAAALALRQLSFALGEFRRNPDRANHPALKPSLAFALLAILAIGFTLYWRSRQHSTEFARRSTPSVRPSPVPSPLPELQAPRGNERGSEEPQPLTVRKKHFRRLPLKQQQPEDVLTLEPNPSPDEGTRGSVPGASGAALRAVKIVHLDFPGEEPPVKQVRESLIANLQAGSRLNVSPDLSKSDAVLRGKLVAGSGGRVSLTVRLINIKGAVLWPIKGPPSGKQYHGSANDIAVRIVRDLLADIQKAERK